MNYYLQEPKEVLNGLKTQSSGLSQAEAKARLARDGKNELKAEKKQSLVSRFLEQLKDPMIIILIAAAVVSGITASYSHESFADVFIIMFVVILNAVLGVFQESKAEKAIEALQKMSASTSRVLRDGSVCTVKSEDLTVGDVILLEAGDAVPADARLLESASLKLEEAALTGESVPVNKFIDILHLTSTTRDIPLGDRKNMVYMGSSVVYGRGTAVVTATGMNTEMGKIADALSNTKEGQTPLQMKLSQLSKVLSYAVLGICAFIFVFSLLRAGSLEAETLLSTFMIAVSLAVAAIPEGLATVVTIVLSIGVTNMSKKRAVIRKLTAVETLGCAQIICSDKTGTLTQNKMTVVKNVCDDETLLATAMALCSDAEAKSETTAIGEPTECALVNFASRIKLNKNDLKVKFPRIAEAPFDSSRKMMSTLHRSEGDKIVQYTKGAPDEILKCCTSILKSNQIVPLTEELRQEVLAANKNMADQALRVLAASMKEYSSLPSSHAPEDLEQGLTFIGLAGMIDPIRPEVLAAVQECKDAGIRTIMITGDHKDTAVAIARELKIISSETEAVTGAQLNDISDADLDKEIEKYSVYARVQPEHKVRIVTAWKKKGMITAMTGDGVNDAPSIKSADIGIGMGITGTDVTKNVADMVLADDNFATIIHAVEEGRRIYDNIRKSIQFLLSSNLSEVLTIFISTLLGFIILKPAHLLWINLITDTFPALALGMEDAESNVMKRKPRDPKEGIFAAGLGINVLYQGVLITAITLLAYFTGHYMESGVWEIAQSSDGITMAFLTLSMIEIFHSFNLRSQTESIFSMRKPNKYLWAAMLASLVLTTAVIYVPFLSGAFGFEHISVPEYLVALGLAFTIIPIVEVIKFFQRKRRK